ncbi:MAG: LPS export ABC transporter periplasmic protein LptC [Calothrix sp. C42_A2020_038]|nr:LPS export ABC transporter periplasmic protein LptC [Calothrix sp. C42_A2020_038]
MFKINRQGIKGGKVDRKFKGVREAVKQKTTYTYFPADSATPTFLSFPRLLLTVLLVFSLFACSSPPPKPQVNQEQPTNQRSDSQLTLFEGSLDATDESGRLVWRVNAKTGRYTKEKEIGQLDNPYGELYQDGKVVYQVTAQKADIQQNGKQLLLKGQIVATDPKNGVVLRGSELEWRPKEDLLIVRNQLNGTHKQLVAVAQEARAKTREQKVDFFGGVVATSNDPALRVRTEHLTWQIQQQKLIGDRPLQFERFKNNQVTDRGKGDAAEVDLNTKIVTITKNAQAELAQPAMQITSKSMVWNLEKEIVTTKTPVRVFHRTENVLVTANQGELRIPQQTVYLQGNVNGVGQRRQTIKSDKLTWYLNNQQVDAEGNVFYQQNNPSLTFTGDTATGNIQQQNIVVRSNSNNTNRVITNIIPQEPNN